MNRATRLFTLAIVVGSCDGRPAVVTAQPTATAIVANAAEPGAWQNPDVLGMNDFTTEPADPTAAIYRSAGITALRYPGGSYSDVVDWRNGSACTPSPAQRPSATFDQIVARVVRAAKLDVEITVNYGTSDQPACDAPGTPEVAAQWVRHANVEQHDGIAWWEIGNEVWGTWERDAHAEAHDAATYAAATAAFSAAMKRQDPTIHIGIPVAGYHTVDRQGNDWDPYVLSHATYDYVAYHAYDGHGGNENDARLLLEGPAKFEAGIATVERELQAAGRPNVPISVSEWNSVYASPGKQSVSIVNGLYAGEVLAEMLRLGIRRAEFWNTFGCEAGPHGNYSPALYGWQDFGSLGAFSEGVPFPTAESGCHWVRDQSVAAGTLFPTARAFELLTQSGFVRSGNRMLDVSVPGAHASIRAYAAMHGNDVDILVFNLDGERAETLPVVVEHAAPFTSVRWFRYGKAEYDRTRNDGPWIGLRHGTLPVARDAVVVTLPPWSMTVYAFSHESGA